MLPVRRDVDTHWTPIWGGSVDKSAPESPHRPPRSASQGCGCVPVRLGSPPSGISAALVERTPSCTAHPSVSRGPCPPRVRHLPFFQLGRLGPITSIPVTDPCPSSSFRRRPARKSTR